MNYIYDVVLNFNKCYYEFYEWKKKDKLLNVKKIPLFRINSSLMNYFKYNIIKVDMSFINKIYNLTTFYSKYDNKYMCLLSDNNETIGVMFDKDGNLIKRSSMVFDEQDECNDEVYNEEEININLLVNKNNEYKFISRCDMEKRDYLNKYINNLDIKNNSNILKYIYYDYFEQELEDVNEIKKVLINEVNTNNDNNKLYNLVKFLNKIKN